VKETAAPRQRIFDEIYIAPSLYQTIDSIAYYTQRIREPTHICRE